METVTRCAGASRCSAIIYGTRNGSLRSCLGLIGSLPYRRLPYTVRSMRTRRGFTLSEITIILVVLGILTTVGIPTYIAVHNNVANTSGSMVLTGAVSQARRVASRQGNHYQYPADLAVALDSMNSKYTDTAAFNNTDVSVYRSSSDVAYFATLIEGERCVIVKDDITTDTQVYAVDNENSDCTAANADGKLITGTYELPNTIDIDS